MSLSRLWTVSGRDLACFLERSHHRISNRVALPLPTPPKTLKLGIVYSHAMYLEHTGPIPDLHRIKLFHSRGEVRMGRV
jgi:hypothetical protein